MQILKEDIRNKINQSAIRLFKQYGYSGISMRKIAQDSNISVGNIYRYYNSKDHLFEQLLDPVIQEIMDLLKADPQLIVHGNQEMIKAFVNKTLKMFLEIHNKHSDELYILVYGLKGSQMEDTVSKVINLLASQFSDWILLFNRNNNKYLDISFTSQLIAKNIVTSCIEILFKFETDEQRLMHMSHIESIYSSFYREVL